MGLAFSGQGGFVGAAFPAETLLYLILTAIFRGRVPTTRHKSTVRYAASRICFISCVMHKSALGLPLALVLARHFLLLPVVKILEPLSSLGARAELT